MTSNNKHELISAINNLRPYQVIDTETGEILEDSEWFPTIKTFLYYCQDKATTMLGQYSCLMNVLLGTGVKIGAPTGFAWKYNIRPNLSDYPKDCHASSRVEKIIQHQAVSLYSSYYYNDNPKKQFPTVPLLANLGAADKQIATIEVRNNICILTSIAGTRNTHCFSCCRNISKTMMSRK